jgi:hypothetical protein
VNSFLREAVELLAGQFDLTVIDAEAGVEQVNRRVMGKVWVGSPKMKPSASSTPPADPFSTSPIVPPCRPPAPSSSGEQVHPFLDEISKPGERK